MPQDLLVFPPYYVVVGAYRLVTDPLIRKAVWDKVKHATVRGLAVAGVYFCLSYRIQRWFVAKFLMGSQNWFAKKFGPDTSRVGSGLGWIKQENMLNFTALLFILPQLTFIMQFFLKRNIRIARSRAWDLTVKSRNKPPEFWSRGYIEEWAQPPTSANSNDPTQPTLLPANLLNWMMFWPVQIFIKYFLLVPISPYLPIANTAFNSAMRGVTTARGLHSEYFKLKRMTPQEQRTWLQERQWAYATFGFTASFLESIPVLGLGFSVSNRVGAAMWAFDLEKRQHLFGKGDLKPLKPEQVSFVGMTKTELPPLAGPDGNIPSQPPTQSVRETNVAPTAGINIQDLGLGKAL